DGIYNVTISSTGPSDTKVITSSFEVLNDSASITFTTTNSSIKEGESTDLEWDATSDVNFEKAYIDNGIGELLTNSGTLTVNPDISTTYTLIAHYTDGAK